MNMMSSFNYQSNSTYVKQTAKPRNPKLTKEKTTMENQLFIKKKDFKNGSQNTVALPNEVEPPATEKEDNNVKGKKIKKTGLSAKKNTTNEANDEGTIRLSCDLPRRFHTALRVSAALSERSILGMIEALIAKHLMDRPADQIVGEYSKRNDTNL